MDDVRHKGAAAATRTLRPVHVQWRTLTCIRSPLYIKPCDVTVADTLGDANLEQSKRGPGCLADHKARGKEQKYSDAAAALEATHLPFAVETIGGLSKSALQLVRKVHHSASTHRKWRDADTIGSHLLDSIAIAVQRCCGMAVRASVEREATRVFGAAAA